MAYSPNTLVWTLLHGGRIWPAVVLEIRPLHCAVRLLGAHAAVLEVEISAIVPYHTIKPNWNALNDEQLADACTHALEFALNQLRIVLLQSLSRPAANNEIVRAQGNVTTSREDCTRVRHSDLDIELLLPRLMGTNNYTIIVSFPGETNKGGSADGSSSGVDREEIAINVTVVEKEEN